MIDKDSVRATLRPHNEKYITLGEELVIRNVMENGVMQEEHIRCNDALHPADPQAEDSTREMFRYFEALGRSSSVLYGHQNDLWDKAGDRTRSFSDTMDAVGDYPALLGMDTLSLAHNEFSAKRYNTEYVGHHGFSEEAVDIASLGTAYGDVVAAARLTNFMKRQGMVISLSAHMPNFVAVRTWDEVAASDGDGELPLIQGTVSEGKAYARYDFTHYTPNDCSVPCVREILPGGSHHAVYRAYLEMVADYLELVEGPLFFRPFHENTGSWFWWGEAHCTPEEFKALYRYTIDYLRGERSIHRLLTVYSPGSEPASVEDFAVRYPGDDYVDMVGVDMYDRATDYGNGEQFLEHLARQLDILERFSGRHGKLMALTEVGLATNAPDEGDTSTAVHRVGNRNPDWYEDILNVTAASSASYLLLWANFGKYNGFYAPYVDDICEDGTRMGQELLDGFIAYYNDERSVFAGAQKAWIEEQIAEGTSAEKEKG